MAEEEEEDEEESLSMAEEEEEEEGALEPPPLDKALEDALNCFVEDSFDVSLGGSSGVTLGAG